jgi:hypothetical protein
LTGPRSSKPQQLIFLRKDPHEENLLDTEKEILNKKGENKCLFQTTKDVVFFITKINNDLSFVNLVLSFVEQSLRFAFRRFQRETHTRLE